MGSLFSPTLIPVQLRFWNNSPLHLKRLTEVMITDIYPAREKYDGTMHACDLARLIPGVVYMNDMDAMKRYILSNAKPGDLVITMGAGNICDLGYSLTQK